MQIARLRQRANILPIIEVEPEFLFVSTILVHIERLPGLRVVAKQSWSFMDSFEAVFDYDGHRFVITLLYGSITINARDATTPLATLQDIVTHINNYRAVWPTQWIVALVRYFFLPYTDELSR